MFESMTRSQALTTLAYLIAAVLFILSLRGLSGQHTARRGNLYGMIGMAIAVLATLTLPGAGLNYPLAGAIAIGALIGAAMSARVGMAQIPEMVALLHSFVGFAAVLVGLSIQLQGASISMGEDVEIYIDVIIGAITLTGSVLAFLKLRGQVSGKPLLLPGRHGLNMILLLAIIGLGFFYAQDGHSRGLLAGAALACFLGIHLVAGIGGADMPVVVSMLNSYSGWTASAAGFMLGNDLLIVTGALVGSSGAILSYLMCRAMNRSIWNVIFGGFGSDSGKVVASAAHPSGDVREIDLDSLADVLAKSKTVTVVPGYGMAVARAQHAVQQLSELLRSRGIVVHFAIHPVAGRLPGHMNVLLAEANVPYDIVMEMDEINTDIQNTDVIIVIGANDIVNPAAEDDPGSPIYGMPVLQVWKSKLVIVNKRSRASGYSGIDNSLFYKENTRMLFGDARDAVEKIVIALQAH